MVWRQVRDRFRAAGLDTPDLDAQLLAQAAFGLSPIQLFNRERQPAPGEGTVRLERFAERRLGGEPVARILGSREFWSLDFILNGATLVPRPETEMLVANALIPLKGRETVRILDLGTGSGAIAVSLLHELPEATAVATDLSSEALEMAFLNAQRHGVATRIEFRRGDWFEPIGVDEHFDAIVSNPPYIATETIPDLLREVREHDPKLALDGGWDGLEAYRRIASKARRQLTPTGALLVEIGSTQGQAVSRLFSRAGFGKVELLQDLQGLDRVVMASHS